MQARESFQVKKAKTGVPSSRSSRHRSNAEELKDNTSTNEEAIPSLSPSPSTGSSQVQKHLPRPSSQTRSSVNTKEQWKKNFETELFDILSQEKIDPDEHHFDKDFYKDQK